MSQLKPNTNYIYERNGDEVYAREFGATERTLNGYDYKPDPRTPDGRPLREHIMEDKLWGEIRRTAKSNPALQKALDRAIMIYRLTKDSPL